MKRASSILPIVILLMWAMPVAAAKPTKEPWPAGPIELAAGEVCAFPVLLEPVTNKETVKTFTLRDGPTWRLITGHFVMRVTNELTGGSQDFNISGPSKLIPTADGGLLAKGRGNQLFWFFPGEPFGPALLLTSGRLDVLFDADFNVVSASIAGHVVDLCARLS